MKNKNVKIVVSGDVCINLLSWKTQHKCTKGLNWQYYPYVHSVIKLGDELLLSKLVALATGEQVLSPKIDYKENYLNNEVLISSVELELFPVTENNKAKVYRIKNFLGYTGVESGMPRLFPIHMDDEEAELVILDDDNNGYNSNKEFWPLAIKEDNKTPIIIYKTNDLGSSNSLWSHLEKYHLNNTIVVINAEDLRSKGVNISKSLSWEKTAQDFVWQMSNNPNLTFLAKCQNLIVLFGVEGAIRYKNAGRLDSELYFLAYEFEGEFIKEDHGKMYGVTSCFVAGITRHVVASIKNGEALDKAMSEGIREGIVAAQKYFVNGFGNYVNESIFPDPSIFKEEINDFIYKENIQNIKIKNTDNSNLGSAWYIIKDKSSVSLADIAFEIVKYGENKALKYIPIARFGNLRTVDRAEIEAYRSIKNLISEYISTNNTVRPLSIAVFGTPGSGKSFGVTEVAASIAPKLIKKINFNLSQFETLADLIAAFHKIRDISLEGQIPLVFFDEFDSAFGGRLGWLKYFLAPMQDGEFREGDAVHPIGKAIFVYAGGTSSTFNEFCGEDIGEKDEGKLLLKEFQNAKGPDFISRLRGYVNILGPNQTDNEWDQLFIIRRAMLLRMLLERKVPHLILDGGKAQIDNGVLRALLKIPRYKHEARSMEAILEMSMLSKAKKWEQSHLPSKEQLKLHVDEEQFSRYLMQDAFFSEKIEKLASELYSNYTLISSGSDKANAGVLRPWEKLDDNQREFILQHARYIPSALYNINYDVVSVKEKPDLVEFTEIELSILTEYEYEHKHNLVEKQKSGWVYLELFDKTDKTTSQRLSWQDLSDDYKKNIIENIKAWPEILANSNFKIERLKF